MNPPMSRVQWYVFSSIRMVAFIAMVWSVGNWVDRVVVSSIAEVAIGFGVLTVGAAVVNAWAVRYETYLEDERERQSGG